MARTSTSKPQPAPLEVKEPVVLPVSRVHAAAIAVLLVLLVAAAFVPCLGNEWVSWDDPENFLKNPFYRGLGWSQISWAWTSFQVGVYQPLGWMILEVEYVLFGMNPWGYHLTSMIFYAINTVVLFLLTLRLLVRCRSGPGVEDARVLVLSAGLAVGLFAVHPLRTEVVVWPSCQTYLPCVLFSMLTVLAYLRAFRDGSVPRHGWVVAAFVLHVTALLSKAVAVSVPVVLLILDVYPLRRLGWGTEPGRWLGPGARRVWLEKVPFAVMSLIFMGLAVVGRVKDQHLVSLQRWGYFPRIAQACYGIWFYMAKTVLPWNITAFYPVPERFVWWDPPFLASMLGTVVVSVGLFLLRGRWPSLLAAWLSYVVILAPNMGLVRIGQQIAADRYSYMSMMGGVVLLAAVLGRLGRVSQRAWPAAMVLTAASGGVLLGLVVLTRAQCRTWRTSESLWAHTVSHGAGENPELHNNLGAALLDQGRLQDAGAQFAETIRLKPDHADAHNNLGAVLKRQGRIEDAMAEYSEAIRLNPDHAVAHNNLGMALNDEGRHEEAMAQYTEALRIDPDLADVHNALGAVLDRQGRFEEAKAKIAEAIRLNPNYAEAHNNLGLALFHQGRAEEAMTEFAEALRIKPNFAEAHNSRGSVLYQQGRIDEAKAEYAEASRLNPKHADAHTNLGSVFFGQGRLDEAKAEFAAAIRLNPRRVEARTNLAAVLLSRGQIQDAMAQYTEVLRLNPNHADAHTNLGSILYHQGRLDEALAQYAEAARLAPNSAGVHNNRARIWATAAEPQYRDGRRAVESATRACELTGWKNAGFVDTLAAACAEAGDFEQAVKWQSQAIELAGDAKAKAAFRTRLGLYQQRHPYHEAIPRR